MTLHTTFVPDKVYSTLEASRWRLLECAQTGCMIGLCHTVLDELVAFPTVPSMHPSRCRLNKATTTFQQL